MLTFILYEFTVLQKIESSGLDGGGTLPGYCPSLIHVRHTRYNILSFVPIWGETKSYKHIHYLLNSPRKFDELHFVWTDCKLLEMST